MKLSSSFCCAALLLPCWLLAAVVEIQPANGSGVYEKGDVPAWEIKPSEPLTALNYELKMNGTTVIHSGPLDPNKTEQTLSVPIEETISEGWLFLEVTATKENGKTERIYGGAIINPQAIRPLFDAPADFDAFWKEKQASLRAIPFSPQIQEVDSGNQKVRLFDVTLQTLNGSKAHAWLAYPKEGHSFPGLVLLQWAGVYPLKKDTVVWRASQGWLVINVMPHDLPLSESSDFYAKQKSGPLAGYATQGQTNREDAYLLGLILRAMRSTDYLCSLPQWNGKTLVTYGASQGGYQSVVIAGLDERVSGMIAHIPAGCELSGVLGGRRMGWPGWTRADAPTETQAITKEVGGYFDAVNFAARVQAPAFIGLGLIDTVCPATGVFSMISQLQSPTELVIMPQAPHQEKGGTHAAYYQRSKEVLVEMQQ
ncbi:acetylxylan esterase [Kiritimatiellota bacterium B12222]|nr:acetylxylan esterase [Kiritimatiellota bacterium B12222]